VKTQLRAVAIAFGDDVLPARQVDGAIATWMPDCRSGSKLLIGLFVVVRAASHETFQLPPPQGTRCVTPVDENQSCTSSPVFADSVSAGGVTLRVRPAVVENVGMNAARL
jgi:hypothetical protein